MRIVRLQAAAVSLTAATLNRHGSVPTCADLVPDLGLLWCLDLITWASFITLDGGLELP